MSVEHYQMQVTLSFTSRDVKVLKMTCLLGFVAMLKKIRLSGVTTGLNDLMRDLVTQSHLRCKLSTAGTVDTRQVAEDYAFQQMQSLELLFAGESHDAVMSNHVIDHSGEANAQACQFIDIPHLMSPNGMGCLALPRRRMPVEQHCRLMFIGGWLQVSRNTYHSLMRKGGFCNFGPLQMRQPECMRECVGRPHFNVYSEAWMRAFDVERPRYSSVFLLQCFRDTLLHLRMLVASALVYPIEAK